MKRLLLLAGIVLGIGRAWAQPGTPTLGNDPVFNRVLARQVSYPIRAMRSGTCGRVYAGFDVDPRGHIQQITILGPQRADVGFETEIRTALKRMPPLSPRYAGRYALPVAFVFTNWLESQEAHAPANVLPRHYMTDRTLLGEVIFTGEIRSAGTYIPSGHDIRYN